MKFTWKAISDMFTLTNDAVSLASDVNLLERTENAIIYRDERLNSVNLTVCIYKHL